MTVRAASRVGLGRRYCTRDTGTHSGLIRGTAEMIDRCSQAGGEHQCHSKDRPERTPGSEGPSQGIDQRTYPDHGGGIARNCDPFKSGWNDRVGTSAAELEQKLQTDQPDDQCGEHPVQPLPCEPIHVRPRPAPSRSRRPPAPTLSRSSNLLAHIREFYLLNRQSQWLVSILTAPVMIAERSIPTIPNAFRSPSKESSS